MKKENEIVEELIEESNELDVFEDSKALINSLSDSSNFFTSMTCKTDDEKKALYNAMANPNYRLIDCVNKTIKVVDVSCEQVTKTNKETGEVYDGLRIILTDIDGNSYNTTSYGIYTCLRRIFNLYGNPTWKNGIPMTIKQKVDGDKRYLSIEL